MGLEEFREHLEKEVTAERIEQLINSMKNLEKVLITEGNDLDSLLKGRLVKYTDKLAQVNPEEASHLISALYNYSSFSGNYWYAEEVIDIAESSSAMENFYKRITEIHGEKLRDEVFEGITVPPLGSYPEKKPATTKLVLKRLEGIIGEEKIVEMLKPCLHGREPLHEARKRFLETGDLDVFLKDEYQKFIKRAENHRDVGSYMFAQMVDDQVLEYIKNTPTMAVGVRKGNEIIVTKAPYQIKKFLNAKDDNMKKFYSCYCPWVRGALKDGTDKEIPAYFCNCSGGFFKMYWDVVFDQPIEVELLESPLLGQTVCKFAVKIPENIMAEFVKK